VGPRTYLSASTKRLFETDERTNKTPARPLVSDQDRLLKKERSPERGKEGSSVPFAAIVSFYHMHTDTFHIHTEASCAHLLLRSDAAIPEQEI
jgi:hypothetical protein